MGSMHVGLGAISMAASESAKKLPGMKTRIYKDEASDHIVVRSHLRPKDLYVQSMADPKALLRMNDKQRDEWIQAMADQQAVKMREHMANEYGISQFYQTPYGLGAAAAQGGALGGLSMGQWAQSSTTTTTTTETKPKESKSMFKSLTDDLRGFIRENKQIIFWIAIALILDHYFLQDAFRNKIRDIVHGMLGKIEKQVNGDADKSAA